MQTRKQLTRRITALEERLAELERRSLTAAPGRTPGPGDERAEEAERLYMQGIENVLNYDHLMVRRKVDA